MSMVLPDAAIEDDIQGMPDPRQTVPLAKAAYYRDDWLKKEIEQLFAGGWLFVGTTAELAENNSFVTLDLPGVALVV
ncbi:MAG: hypothetical protein EOO83_05615, partial [Oxalobacteraceae bacterium]